VPLLLARTPTPQVLANPHKWRAVVWEAAVRHACAFGDRARSVRDQLSNPSGLPAPRCRATTGPARPPAAPSGQYPRTYGQEPTLLTDYMFFHGARQASKRPSTTVAPSLHAGAGPQ
jgi:hypothetical protein